MSSRTTKKLDDSLSTEHGCLFYGSRVVIPAHLQDQMLDLLRHIGMQRMKQLARSAVDWPRIDRDIEQINRQCTACAEFQMCMACKPAIHSWMLPEKPWSRLQIDHGINFLGRGGTKTPDGCLPLSPRFMVQGVIMSRSAQEDLSGIDTLNS